MAATTPAISNSHPSDSRAAFDCGTDAATVGGAVTVAIGGVAGGGGSAAGGGAGSVAAAFVVAAGFVLVVGFVVVDLVLVLRRAGVRDRLPLRVGGRAVDDEDEDV